MFHERTFDPRASLSFWRLRLVGVGTLRRFGRVARDLVHPVRFDMRPDQELALGVMHIRN